jgi:hypothetical protein
MLIVRIDSKKYHAITLKTYEDNIDIVSMSGQYDEVYHRAWALVEEFKYAYFSYKMGKINGVISSYKELEYFDLYY